MSIAAGNSLILIGIIVFIFLIVVQVFLSTRKNIVFGFIMPLIFLIIAGYNLYMEFFPYNPYPTMKRGMYETLGFSGFLVSLVILLISRMIIRRHKDK